MSEFFHDRLRSGLWFQSQCQTWSGPECRAWIATLIVATGSVAPAQEALRNSMTGAEPEPARELQPESIPYTLKSGDFRLLVTPSLELNWNDNVSLSKANTVQDFILRPLLDFDGSHPIGQRNLLRLKVGIGYDQYLEHDEYSALRLVSGSQLAFDAYIKDFRINVHNRFQYIQDPADQPSVATTGRYGGFDNTVGIFGAWDLRNLALNLGCDHQSFVSSSSEFDYLNRASEMFIARAGIRLNPGITVGVEGGGSLTTYEGDLLDDNRGYSGGFFAHWTSGRFLRVQARAGYCGYFLDHPGQVITAMNDDAVYATLTVTHDISEAVNYSLHAGRELRLGTSADLIEDWYVRPSVNWKIIKNLNVTTFLSYEHGRQGPATQTGALAEKYDWLGSGVILSHSITKRLMVAFNYRLTLRSSDEAYREYAQNLVGLRLTYGFE